VDGVTHGDSRIMKIVIVEWIDSCGYGLSWEKREPWTEKPVKCITSGFLLHEDEESVFIVLSLSKDTYTHGEAIPKSCITRMRTLVVRRDNDSKQ